MKRFLALVCSLVAIVGCSAPTEPSSDQAAARAAYAKAMLEAASNVGVLAGRNLN